MTVAELKAVIKTVMDEQSVSKVKNEASSISGWLKKAIGFAGISLSLVGVKNFLSECNSIAAEVKATNTQFDQTFKTLDESGAAIADFSKEAEEALENVSQKTGIMSTRMKASFASLGAFAKTGGMETAQSIDFAARAAEAAADSAAYFDKSIEETMDIMKRLMKGNFTLDDNLGFQSTQVTRDADALALYGKKYQELESYQQQEVILQQIINANMRMGAAGQAAREAGEYTNQIGELNENIKMLKANIGMIGLPIVLSFTQKITAVTHHLKEYVGDVNDETSRAHKIQERLTRGMDRVEGIIGWIVDKGRSLVDMVGGADNAIRVLIGTVGVFLGLNALSRIGDGLKVISSLLDPVKLKVLATFGAALLLFLLIEDFIGFMNGKDSLFGDALEAAGYDTDEVREKIANFLTEAKEDFNLIIEKVKDIGKTLTDVFSPNDLDIFREGLGRLNTELDLTGEYLKAIGEYIKDLFTFQWDDLLQDAENIATAKANLKAFKEGEDVKEAAQRKAAMKENAQRNGTTVNSINRTATQAGNDVAAKYLGYNPYLQANQLLTDSNTKASASSQDLSGRQDILNEKLEKNKQKSDEYSRKLDSTASSAQSLTSDLGALKGAFDALSSGVQNLINMAGNGMTNWAIGNYNLPGVGRNVTINQTNNNQFNGIASTAQAANQVTAGYKDSTRDIQNAYVM